jgi:hypothetical protein
MSYWLMLLQLQFSGVVVGVSGWTDWDPPKVKSCARGVECEWESCCTSKALFSVEVSSLSLSSVAVFVVAVFVLFLFDLCLSRQSCLHLLVTTHGITRRPELSVCRFLGYSRLCRIVVSLVVRL